MFAALGDKETTNFVNQKVKKFIALAPVVYLPNVSSKFFLALSKDWVMIDAAKIFGVEEWLPGACSKTSIQSDFESLVCKTIPILCDFVIGAMDFNPKYDNEKMMPTFVKYNPSGTSMKAMLHYKQLIFDQNKHFPKFVKYDYGKAENLKKYGQPTAPEYDLSLINIPVRGFVCTGDELGDVIDNSILDANLRNLGRDYKAYVYDHCGHITYMWAIDASPIFNDVLAEIASA